MDKLFDDISCILASPVPRRKALRLVAGGFASAALAAFGLKRAEAVSCGIGQIPCGTKCCTTSSQECCGGTTCCAKTVVCCAKKCCNPGDACVESKCKRQPPSPTQP